MIHNILSMHDFWKLLMFIGLGVLYLWLCVQLGSFIARRRGRWPRPNLRPAPPIPQQRRKPRPPTDEQPYDWKDSGL